MNLNLGCGDRYADGWTNVDHAGLPYRKDQEVDLSGPLPWPDATVDAAYCGHLLEHLTMPQCVLLLARLWHCMRPGGELLIVGPDLDMARQMQDEGVLDVPMDGLLHGAHRWPGDEHQWESRPAPVRNMLHLTGWVNIREIPIGDVEQRWPVADRGPRWQFAVYATRPAG